MPPQNDQLVPLGQLKQAILEFHDDRKDCLRFRVECKYTTERTSEMWITVDRFYSSKAAMSHLDWLVHSSDIEKLMVRHIDVNQDFIQQISSIAAKITLEELIFHNCSFVDSAKDIVQARLAHCANSLLGRDVFRVNNDCMGRLLSRFPDVKKLTLDGDFAKGKLSNAFLEALAQTSVTQLRIYVRQHSAPTDLTPLDDGICRLVRTAQASHRSLEPSNVPVSSIFCQKLNHEDICDEEYMTGSNPESDNYEITSPKGVFFVKVSFKEYFKGALDLCDIEVRHENAHK